MRKGWRVARRRHSTGSRHRRALTAKGIAYFVGRELHADYTECKITPMLPMYAARTRGGVMADTKKPLNGIFDNRRTMHREVWVEGINSKANGTRPCVLRI